MDSVLDYHIEQTEKKFDEIKADLQDLSLKLDDLKTFKIEMVATSRLISFIVSAVSGLITITISTLIAIKYH